MSCVPSSLWCQLAGPAARFGSGRAWVVEHSPRAAPGEWTSRSSMVTVPVRHRHELELRVGGVLFPAGAPGSLALSCPSSPFFNQIRNSRFPDGPFALRGPGTVQPPVPCGLPTRRVFLKCTPVSHPPTDGGGSALCDNLERGPGFAALVTSIGLLAHERGLCKPRCALTPMRVGGRITAYVGDGAAWTPTASIGS